MSEELKIIQNDDGTFSEYDDTFDITIHCQSEEEQNEVMAKLNAPQPNKWIPVIEKLPEIHQDVIFSLRSLDIEIGFRAETEPYFYCHGADGCYIDPKNVLAWMPLPEPYKQEVGE